ncbi:hypothetical protein PCASD_21988 [Puccinia coronata f. sp. avenae]|uniref:Uncharacterized protein n=1 Tax=Puccinia coronata f. sp. avenae TaxID=200324 RepID=A0A2N5U3B1_9BASI|nr:hypothetical protein PCASD_21988 [Puccinia coronata f. sp. avenae]
MAARQAGVHWHSGQLGEQAHLPAMLVYTSSAVRCAFPLCWWHQLGKQAHLLAMLVYTSSQSRCAQPPIWCPPAWRPGTVPQQPGIVKGAVPTIGPICPHASWTGTSPMVGKAPWSRSWSLLRTLAWWVDTVPRLRGLDFSHRDQPSNGYRSSPESTPGCWQTVSTHQASVRRRAYRP